MKKLKFLTLAAIAAATAMVSSCSDNGDLSTPTKEAEGKALVVNPTVLDSRVTPLAKGAFTGFKLYGIQNPTNGESVGSFVNTGTDYGVNYSGTFGESAAEVAFAPATTVKWPTKNPDNSANFYGISVQGGADLSESGITVTETGIKNGTFSYTAPVDGDGNVDLSKQKDIMIASSIGATQTGNDGVVTLPFKHAFAKLTLQVRWNHLEWIKGKSGSPASVIGKGAILVIDYIKIHNIKCQGTYSFTADDGNGGKGRWTVDGENSTIMFKYNSPRHFSAKENPTAEIPFEVQDLIVGDDAIMILPQTLGVWSKGTNFTDETAKAFVEIHGLAYNITDALEYEGEDYVANVEYWDDFLGGEGDQYYSSIFSSEDDADRDMESIYFPIRITVNTGTPESPVYEYRPFVFEQNKTYNIRLNVATSRQDNGTNAIKGVVLDDN